MPASISGIRRAACRASTTRPLVDRGRGRRRTQFAPRHGLAGSDGQPESTAADGLTGPCCAARFAWVDLDPALRGEADKMRPAVIVSNDGANSAAARLGHGVVTIVPVTTAVDRLYPFQVLLPANETGLAIDSKAHAEQVRAVSYQRLRDLIGSVPAPLMLEVDDALRPSGAEGESGSDFSFNLTSTWSPRAGTPHRCDEPDDADRGSR